MLYYFWNEKNIDPIDFLSKDVPHQIVLMLFYQKKKEDEIKAIENMRFNSRLKNIKI